MLMPFLVLLASITRVFIALATKSGKTLAESGAYIGDVNTHI
jgi:hypothetical protein